VDDGEGNCSKRVHIATGQVTEYVWGHHKRLVSVIDRLSEGDLGSLLAFRLLMSVSGESCHRGNSDPRAEGTFRINHSNPALKMNGFDRPDLPYQLGRFVSKGWGTKFAVDFMNNAEKTVTVARVDPSATRLLVLKGQLVGASGWGLDLIGCSVEALIKPPEGRVEEFLKKRACTEFCARDAAGRGQSPRSGSTSATISNGSTETTRKSCGRSVRC